MIGKQAITSCACSVTLSIFAHAAEIDLLKKVVDRLPKVPVGLNEAYYMNRSFSHRVIGSHKCVYSAPSYRAYRWNYTFAHPPQHPGQKVIAVQSSPKGELKKDRSVLARPLWMVDHLVGSKGKKQRFEVEFKVAVDLYARSLEKKAGRVTKVAPLKKEERLRALLPLKHLRYNHKSFGQWMTEHQLKRVKGEGEVDYGRRIFLFLAGYFDYEYLSYTQDRMLKTVCDSKKTDCAGMSAVFVAVLRSQGIPARTLAGRWAKSSKLNFLGGESYGQEHVIAEFFAQGVGWVPVDVSSAETKKDEMNRLVYFGQSPANFVLFHIDTDLRYHSKLYGGEDAALLQSPAIQLLGAGSLDDGNLKETWKVERKAR